MNNKEKPLSEFTRRHETARRLERHAGSETCNGIGAVRLVELKKQLYEVLEVEQIIICRI